jgi:hypothetical protein
MGVDLGDWSAALGSLPLAMLYAGATALFLLALVALRFIANSLPTKAPPIFEGLPFLGGILKFTSVSEMHKCQKTPRHCSLPARQPDISHESWRQRLLGECRTSVQHFQIPGWI